MDIKKLLKELLLEDIDGRFQFGTQKAFEENAVVDDGLLFFTIDTLRIYKGRVNYTEFVVVVERLPKPKRAIPGKLYVDTTNKRLSILDETGAKWLHIINGKPFSLVLSVEEPTDQQDGDVWYEDLGDGEAVEPPEPQDPPEETVEPDETEEPTDDSDDCDCEDGCDCEDCEKCTPAEPLEDTDEELDEESEEDDEPISPHTHRLVSCDYCGRGVYGCIHTTGGDTDGD